MKTLVGIVVWMFAILTYATLVAGIILGAVAGLRADVPADAAIWLCFAAAGTGALTAVMIGFYDEIVQ